MIEQIDKSNHKSKKNIPRGCFDAQLASKYLLIKNYLLIRDMYNIVTPFRYQFLNYVIVKAKNPQEGQLLQLYHQTSKRLILKAYPKSGQIGCKFIIFCPITNKVIARVRGDLLGNKFFVFDGGHNPKKKRFPSRKQLAYVYTNNNQFFSQKPPDITAVLANHSKRIADDDELQKFGTLFQAEGILQLQQTTSQLLKAETENSKRVYSIKSIQPQYCSSKKGYIMDLKGLITEPSPLNMVMKTMTNQDCIVMGKRSENTYSLFVGSPLTLVQGFGIFLSNFVIRKQ